jgi:uncharacterized protein involved in exopolysaccharide biosynthesis
MADETEGTQEQGSNADPMAQLRSYLAFARRGLRSRRTLGITVALSLLVLTALIARFIPRTYTCSTVLMTVETEVLDGDRGPRPLAGAEGLIMRHENLEALIRATHLVDTYAMRRPPLLRLKDRIFESVFGKMDKKTLMAVLVGTLESRLTVEVDPKQQRDMLQITVNWGDSKTAAELAQATKDGFLQIRHAAEISAFQEKMVILDSHAATLREEVATLGEQVEAATAAKVAEVSKSGGASPAAAGSVKSTKSSINLGSLAKPAPVVDAQLPERKEKLSELKQKLAAAENERSGRMNVEQAKLDELKLRFTPSHPQVITQEERVGMVSNVSSELALLRSEVADLQMQVNQREAMVTTGQALPSRIARGASDLGGNADLLPADILRLLDREGGDPALKAQLSGAIVRYGALRDEVRGAKLALDTAQAAFNHRYQVVIPVEEPNKAGKPNIPVIVGVGIFLALLLGLLVPILLELRRGVLVENWQVHTFQLPVLAELRLPSRSEN